MHGSTPWLGVDPMPAAADTIVGAGQLYRQTPAFDPIAITSGHVEDVGRFNVIPGHVVLLGTIRCSADSDMAAIQGRLKGMAEHIAQAYGCTATVEYLQDVPPLHNTQAWMDAAMPTLERAAGKDTIIEMPSSLGYDDVSVFVKAFGGIYLTYGIQDTRTDPATVLAPLEGGCSLAPNHNPGFHAGEDSLQTSVRIHANIAVDHLTRHTSPAADQRGAPLGALPPAAS